MKNGAYVVKITSHDNNVTLVASGTEVELALKVQDKLKENNIHSKVVSMPCMELFDKQSEEYKKDLIEERIFNCNIRSWKYYIVAKIYLKIKV